jgi:5'-deoxynucleotidase YfbR-like HD superfamily hydrolase
MIHLLKWSNLNQEKFDLREKNIFHEKVEAQINEEKFKENLNQFISDPENTNKYQRLVEYLEMFVNKEHKFHKDQEGAVRNWLFFVFKKSSKKTKNFKNLIFDRLTED